VARTVFKLAILRVLRVFELLTEYMAQRCITGRISKRGMFTVAPGKTTEILKKVNLSLYQAVETHRLVRRQSFHIFFLNNRVTYDVVVASLMSRQHFTPPPPNNIPGTHFCQRLSRPEEHSAAGKIMQIEKVL
jgi:hypothetical protein